MRTACILLLAIAMALALAFVFNGCADGPDLYRRADAAVVALTAGCESPPPADAGPDPCACPDGGDIVVLPTCGVICGL